MASFMDLSPEIRNIIYYYTENLVLSSRSIVRLRAHSRTYYSHYSYEEATAKTVIFWGIPAVRASPRSSPRQPEITRVSRKLRAETLPIFYGANRFVFRLHWHEDDYSEEVCQVAWIVRWFAKIEAHVGLLRDLVYVHSVVLVWKS